MSVLKDGQPVEVWGSGKKPYVLKNVGGVFSCTCPAWCNQSLPINARTCKHLKRELGEAHEAKRIAAYYSGVPFSAGSPPVPAAPVAAAPPPVETLSALNGRKFSARPVAPAPTPVPAKNVPPVLLAHSWDQSIDPTGMWMSEKLDGVRAWWDGKTFWSRQGNEYKAPAWFTEHLPNDMILDGELWAGRKQFQKAVSIVRRDDRSDDWKDITYVVFDAPKVPGGFEARMAAVTDYLLNEIPPSTIVTAIKNEKVKSAKHLAYALEQAEEQGAEGLMLRAPGSLYEEGRSMTLLKVKSFLDGDAVVVGHSAGKGRHKGRVGALECRLANGKEFSVGSGLTDKDRENPPPIGTTIVFQYQELTNDGIPRFPTYIGVRGD